MSGAGGEEKQACKCIGAHITFFLHFYIYKCCHSKKVLLSGEEAKNML